MFEPIVRVYMCVHCACNFNIFFLMHMSILALERLCYGETSVSTFFDTRIFSFSVTVVIIKYAIYDRCVSMAKKSSIQKRKLYKSNHARQKRHFLKEKKRIDDEILNVNCENSFISVESVNANNESETAETKIAFHDKLREWALKYNVRTYCLRDLMKILTEIGIPFLPKEPTTFLRTPKVCEIENIANGQLWYPGVANHLCRIFQMMSEDMNIELNFHVDGLQLFNSSSKQFWPILGQVHG